MSPGGGFRSIRDWLGASSRHRLLAGGCAAAAATVLTAAGAYFVLSGGGESAPAGPSPTPVSPLACESTSLIDPLPPDTGSDWASVPKPAFNDCFRLTPEEADAGGVATGSAFVLESGTPLSVGAVTARLHVEPPVALTVTEAPGGAVSAHAVGQTPQTYRYRVQPAAALTEGSLYRFTLVDEQGQPQSAWAFETQVKLRVVATLPADQATAVPLNLGIELTFSHDGVTGAEELFTIDPPTEGRFEVHKRVLAFVPKELQPETLYTVTLRAGAGTAGSGLTIGQDFVFQFETGATTREGQTPGYPRYQFSRRVWDAATSDPPAMGMFSYNYFPGTPTPENLGFTVFRFPDRDGYVSALDQMTSVPSWAYLAQSRQTLDTSGLEVQAQFSAELHASTQYGDRYVLFPEALPTGYYLVQTDVGEGLTAQALLEVTDIASYAALSAPKLLVWANDISTGGPLEGATVRLAGSDEALGQTGPDGAAMLATPDGFVSQRTNQYGYAQTETKGTLVVTAPDGREGVVPLGDIYSGSRGYGLFDEYFGYYGNAGPYWRYLYLDRPLYHPDDVIHFWGLVRNRENPAGGLNLAVEASGTVYTPSGGSSQEVVLSRGTVTTSDAGTLIGELPLNAASPGYYDVRLKLGDQVVATAFFQVQEFVKPAYKIEVEPSQRAVFAGDQIEFGVTAKFFDGTPLPNLDLQYNFRGGYQSEQAGQRTTDAAGRATVVVATSLNGDVYGGYSGVYFTASPARAEEGEISGSAWVQVFPAALTLDLQSSYADGTGTVSGTVLNVDLGRLNSGDEHGFDDFRGAPAPGRTVTATVTQTAWTKTEAGETYDFIAKIVRKMYNYQQQTTVIGDYTSVSGGDGRFSVSFPAQPDSNYSVRLVVVDDAGRPYAGSAYVDSGQPYTYQDDRLSAAPEGPYRVGDQVSLSIERSDGDLPAGGSNRYLFVEARAGIRGFAIEGQPAHSVTFSEDNIPNVTFRAVWFTGQTYEEIQSPVSLALDPQERALYITVTPEKERYAPGDDATLNVTVTDKDGNPKQAEVLFSAVDEAFYAVQGDVYQYQTDILSSIYSPVSSGIYATFASHTEAAPATGGRGGDGGGREDFADIALFDRIVTGADGRGSITFHLPDNLTSWRVTAFALSPDLYAGRIVAQVQVGLPLFVDVAMSTSYLVSDQPNIKLRAFGDALSPGDPVSFEVSWPTLSADALQVSGTAFEPIEVAIPALVEGRHDITVRVRAGGLEDAVIRTVTVVPSRLLRSQSHYYEISPGQALAAEGAQSGVTNLTITDHNRGRYLPELRELSWTWGDRLDQMLARNISQDLMRQYFDEESWFPAEFTPATYQMAGGGLAIFPFADADLTLSARAAAVSPDSFGRQALAGYFRGVLDEDGVTRERVAIALYGLAALGEPVVLEVQGLAAQQDLTVRERLYIALAAAELGDETTARTLYGGLVAEFGQRRGNSMRLHVVGNSDDILEATSLAAILGAHLGDDYAPLLFEYTTFNYTKDILVQLEQISYLTEALPRMAAGPVHVAYTFNGQREDRMLDRGQLVMLPLRPDGLAALNLQVLEGTAGVTSSYLAGFDPASIEADPESSISRAYADQTGDTATLREGDLVAITLNWDLQETALDGCYQVSDLLPSGLRAVTDPWKLGVTNTLYSYPYSIEGQRVNFCAAKGSTIKSFLYYARVVATGSFAAEPAIIQSQRAPETLNVTEPLRVEITP